MKCRYCFKIYGKIKIAVNEPISIRGKLFEFKTENGVIKHICVTVPVTNKADWPTITPSSKPGVNGEIKISSPYLLTIQNELRNVEGLLSFYGLRSIDIQMPEIEWIPDSEEEKKELKLYSFKQSYSEIDVSELPPLSFDLVARTVIAASDANEIEVPLSFFRKGMIDIYEKRYIEAIYDFYFMLESLFGDGKTKNFQIKESFENSDQLKSCIKKVIEPSNLQFFESKDESKKFFEKYGYMNSEEIIEHIVDLRGFLHHHSLKRKDIWHPEEHKKYKLDALLLQSIAFNVGMELFNEYVLNENVVKIYKDMFLKEEES